MTLIHDINMQGAKHLPVQKTVYGPKNPDHQGKFRYWQLNASPLHPFRKTFPGNALGGILTFQDESWLGSGWDTPETDDAAREGGPGSPKKRHCAPSSSAIARNAAEFVFVCLIPAVLRTLPLARWLVIVDLGGLACIQYRGSNNA